MVSQAEGEANLNSMSRKYAGQSRKKIQRVFIRLALLLNKKGIGGNLKNLDNGKCPHIVVHFPHGTFSSVYFAARREWQVFDGYGAKSTKAWHFKQYAHVARFFESKCTDESEATCVRNLDNS